MISVPAEILTWPEHLKYQWLADELWHQATGEQEPAPIAFVADFVEAARLASP